MQRPLNILLFSLLFGMGLILGCAEDDAEPTPPATADYGPIIARFAQEVAVPTYAALRDRAADLQAAVATANTDPDNQELLAEAAAAWTATRVPWEQSEAFLFGPVSTGGLDPSLDSWPVDAQQLDEVLASEFELTAEFVANGLGTTLRGFHTIEYLLFRDGQPRDAHSISTREREYLGAVCEVLHQDATALWSEWAAGFADEFARAGEPGSRYGSPTAALEEILDGMIAICDEVANGKIADPFDEQDPRLVESQFSWNSLQDFADNLRSVKHGLWGAVGATAPQEHSLYEAVAEHDAALAARLSNEIDQAILRIQQIPYPFRNNLQATTEITAAQAAIMAVMNTVAGDIKPLVIN